MKALPAGELIATGIEDLQLERHTIPALLVAIGAPKLRSLGLIIPEHLPDHPEHRLYALLSATEPDAAHSKYNALIRKLVSFQRAFTCVRKLYRYPAIDAKSFRQAVEHCLETSE
jgi:hypothetical protein